LAVERWPIPLDAAAESGAPARAGVASVWALETAKLAGQLRVRVAMGACLVAPFALLAAVKVQSSLPSDTLFGQWLHSSGFALPMVLVAFIGQWVLPLLASIVAGDIFSAEDHFGTWKTVLTRSRTRGQIFTGKVLAATTYTVFALAVLAASSLVAGVLLGTQPWGWWPRRGPRSSRRCSDFACWQSCCQ
jgi:ABC-2 type transport system permease protein